MQVLGLLNQLSAGSTAVGTRRIGHSKDVHSAWLTMPESQRVQSTGVFGKTLQQKQINQVKQEIYDRFEISVGSYGKSFSCHIPSSVLYQMSRNPQMKEKVYEQLESYSPENYQASIAGLNPPVRKCTLVFDEGGNATATLEAAATTLEVAATEQELHNFSSNSLYQSYLLRQASMLPYQSGLYSGYGAGSGYGPNSWYGLGYPYTATSLYGANSLYKSNSLFSTVMGRLFQRI